VTETKGQENALWASVLSHVARASGHELRNSLNALVVNLEVVRSRIPKNDPAGFFIAQAVEQSEESVRLAEGAIALLNLVVGAMGDGRSPRIISTGPYTARVESSEPEAQRAVYALRALAARTSIRAESADSAVILTIPESSPDP
jgi:hypothetical protein